MEFAMQHNVVIGAGLMGHGIALDFALAGLHVNLIDVNNAAVERGRHLIDDSLEVMRRCGQVSADQARSARELITLSIDLRAATVDADIVIESIVEDIERKRKLFQELDQCCPTRTILASNSSSFPPSRIAAATTRPQQCLGTHFFNPPYLIPLVEVIMGRETAEQTKDVVVSLLAQIGKTPVLVRKEVPGFIANRIQAAVWREILSLVAAGIATAEDIDLVVKSSVGRRWSVAGPFEITDLAGLDLKRAILTELLPTLAADTEVSPILREMVERGKSGAKSGEGFYSWTPDQARQARARIAQALTAISRWPDAPS